jgi:hypothetical protein
MIACSKITNTYYHDDKVITEAKYNEILAMLRNIPTAPGGYGYRLTENLEWEQYKLPAEESETNEGDDV